MDQIGLPGVRVEAEDNDREQRFLKSLEGDSVVVEFPRNPIDSSHDPSSVPTVEYLKEFTASNPEHSFMWFETMSSAYGFLFPHLIRIDITERSRAEDETANIQKLLVDLHRNPPEGLVLHSSKRPYYTLVHAGQAYFAMDASPYDGEYELGPIGFRLMGDS